MSDIEIENELIEKNDLDIDNIDENDTTVTKYEEENEFEDNAVFRIDYKTRIYVEFHDSHSLNNLIISLDGEGNHNIGLNMIFSKEGIFIEQANGNNSIYSRTYIYANELTSYIYESKCDQYLAGCSYEDITGNLSNGKKEKIIIQKFPESKSLYIQTFIKGVEGGIIPIPYRNNDLLDHGFNNMPDFPSKPYMICSTQSFHNICEDLKKCKKAKIVNICFKFPHIEFIGKDNQGNIKRVHKLENSNKNQIQKIKNIKYKSEEDDDNLLLNINEEEYEFIIDVNFMKHFCKILSYSGPSTIKIYVNESAIKLGIHLLTYGYHYKYIRNPIKKR